MPDPKPANDEPQTFEAAMARLERIVEEMDDSALPLEDLIVRFSEGTKLVKVCEERLAAVEKKIEIIQHTAAGAPVLAEFDPAGAATAKTGAKREDVSLF